MFHTALGSGATAVLAPLTAVDKRGDESLTPGPVFATRRGREAESDDDPEGGVLEPCTGLSTALEPGAALEAKKVLFTETALKVAGFLAEEFVRPCSLSLSLCRPNREASVSDPPLKLTSAEYDCSSEIEGRTMGTSSFTRIGWPFKIGTS